MTNNETNETPPAHSVAELARVMNVHRVSVYRQIWAGEIEVVRFGGVIRITDHEFRRVTGTEKA